MRLNRVVRVELNSNSASSVSSLSSGALGDLSPPSSREHLGDRPDAPHAILQLGEIAAVAGENAEIVLLHDGVEQALSVLRRHLLVGTQDQQQASAGSLDVLDLRQGQQISE